MQVNLGARWDYQQMRTTQLTFLKLNDFRDNLQPRVGLIWDFTGKGKGKLFINYARFLEAPIPTIFSFSGGGVSLSSTAQVDRVNAPAGSMILRNDGSCCGPTPVDSDLKPQTVDETAAGVEYETDHGLLLGVRGV